MEAAPNCTFPDEFGLRERSMPAASDLHLSSLMAGQVLDGLVDLIYCFLSYWTKLIDLI